MKTHYKKKLVNLFDYSFRWTSNKFHPSAKKRPILTMKLKTRKESPYMISPSDVNYFYHHFGKTEFAKEVYDFRRKYFRMENLAQLMLDNGKLSKKDFLSFIKYMNERNAYGEIAKKQKLNTPEVLAKIRKSNKRTAKSRGLQVAAAWADPEGRKRYMDSLMDPDVRKRTVENFLITINKDKEKYLAAMRKPSRKKKIGAASKAYWDKLTPEERSKRTPSFKKKFEFNGVKMTSIEAKLARWLYGNNISFLYEHGFSVTDKKTYFPDFYLPSHNVIIECLGDYHHANPKRYKANQIVYSDRKAKSIWKQDGERFEYFESLEMKVFKFWGTDLNKNFETTILPLKELIMNDYIEEEITLKELADRFEISDQVGTTDLSDKGIEVLSYDLELKTNVYRPLTHYVVKEDVDVCYVLGDLKGTSNHRVLHNDNWVSLKDHPDAILMNEPMKVVDVSVDETECYVANGQINHNTTSGGMALPFHASVRISMVGGGKITDDAGQVIGINVKAKTIKNKIAPPHRDASFQLIFGQGLSDHEELFDHFREQCEANECIDENGISYKMLGKSGNKSFVVADKDGKILVDKSFYKKDMKTKIINNPETASHYRKMANLIMIKKPLKRDEETSSEPSGETDAAE